MKRIYIIGVFAFGGVLTGYSQTDCKHNVSTNYENPTNPLRSSCTASINIKIIV